MDDMGANAQPFQVCIISLMARGHMLPALVPSTERWSPSSSPPPTPSSRTPNHPPRAASAGHRLHLHTFPAPKPDSPTVSNKANQSTSPDTFTRFVKAPELLQQPVENLIEHVRLNCLFSDVYLPWAVDTAHEFPISSLVFSGRSCFALPACLSLARHQPRLQHVESETKQPFVLPGLESN